MKKIILLISVVALFSCSKSKENIVEKPKIISGTFWLHQYDHNNTYRGTILSFHQCRIEDPMIVKQWEDYPALSPICDSNDILELVLSKPCPVPCPIKTTEQKIVR